MKLGRVVGTVVCAQQHQFYEGKKQMIVRFTTPDGSFDGKKYVVAIDLVGCGVGETVLVEDEGTSARQLLDEDKCAPVRSVIIGIVDQVEHSS
jgi:microcompartment protein CcmK/EutM